MQPSHSESEYQNEIIELFQYGYSDDVRRYTESIRFKAVQVQNFEYALDICLTEAMVDYDEIEEFKGLFRIIEESTSAMDEFFIDSDVDYERYLRFYNHFGNKCSIEIGWLHPNSGFVTWENWVMMFEDPVMAYCTVGFMFDIKHYICQRENIARAALPPLYRYHPERYKAYRDFATAIGNFYKKSVTNKYGLLDVDQLNEIMNLVVSEFNSKIVNTPRRDIMRKLYPPASTIVQTEEILSSAYGRFIQCGKQIMDFPPLLMELLSNTDVDEIPIGSIKLPYASQYIYFGPQEKMEMDGICWVDGVYVEQRSENGGLRFTLTTVPKDTKDSEIWYLMPEVTYTQDLIFESGDICISEAVEKVLQTQLSDLQRKIEYIGESRYGNQIKDNNAEMSRLRQTIILSRHPVYQAAIKLAINALCYIVAYPNDMKQVWPKETPPKLLNKLKTSSEKMRKKIQSRLESLGYTPVHICGQKLTLDHVGNAHQNSFHPKSHWRRGHWRNQPYGQGREMRRLIWIMPTLVGGVTEEQPNGHIYLVS